MRRTSSTLTPGNAHPYDGGVNLGTHLARWMSLVLFGALTLSFPDGAEAQRRRRDREPTTTAAPAAPSRVFFSGLPDGAEILIDEQRVGVAPVAGPIETTVGEHALRVRLEGYSEYTDVIRVVAGQDLRVPVDLIPISHVVTVESEPTGARVFVDESYAGDAPTELELREGNHTLRLSLAGYEALTQPFEATAGHRDSLHLTLTLLPPPTAPQWFEDPIIWIVTGVVVAVAVGVTVGIIVATQGQQSAYDAFCSDPANPCIRFEPPF